MVFGSIPDRLEVGVSPILFSGLHSRIREIIETRPQVQPVLLN